MVAPFPRCWLVTGSLRSGGTERQVVGLANELARRGEPVGLAVIDGRSPSAYVLDERVVVRGLASGGVLGFLAATLRLGRIVRRAEVVYSLLDIANVMAAVATIGSGARVVWGVRSAGIADGAAARVALWLSRLLSRRVTVMIGNAQACLDFYAAHGVRPDRRIVVANGIDVDDWRPDPTARAALRRELGLGDDVFLVGFVARADRAKRHDLLLNALRLCPESVHLVLVGRGTDVRGGSIDACIDALGVRQRVHALGERRDVPRLTAAFDLACCASAYEGFPNSVLEGLASGVCCIASDVGGARDVLGDAGVVVGADSVEEWARAINTLREDPAKRAILAQAGRRRAETRFSMRAMVDATLAAIGA